MNLPGDVRSSATVLAALVLVGTCGCRPVGQRDPEILLFNGRIFTGTAPSFVEAVLIRGSRVIGIGSTEHLTATADADARRIDLAGRLAIPGINDAHLHMDFFVPEHTTLRFESMDLPAHSFWIVSGKRSARHPTRTRSSVPSARRRSSRKSVPRRRWIGSRLNTL